MKKIRILSALLALILCASMLLTACGNKDKEEEKEDETEAEEMEELEENPTVKLADIMNKNWKADAATSGLIKKISKLDIKGGIINAEAAFAISKESDPEEGAFPENSSDKSIIRVYDVNTNKLLLTKNNSTSKVEKNAVDDWGYTYTKTLYTYNYDYIDVINDNYFAVLNMKRMTVYNYDYTDSAYTFKNGCFAEYSSDYLYSFNEDEENEDDAYVIYTLTIYDATGNAVRTINHEQFKTLCDDSIYNFSYYNPTVYSTLIKRYQPETYGATTYGEFIVKDGKVYRNDKDGKPTLVKDYGMSKMPKWNYLTKSGNYYLEENGYTYTVYDKDLNKVFDYTNPNYDGYGSEVAFLLANGSILAQYSIQLDQDATEFDYRAGADEKYDLVTVIATKDGVEEVKGVNYIITSVVASVAEDGQKIYSDSLENDQGVTLFANYLGSDIADEGGNAISSDENYFNSSIENLAIIYPINANKMLDQSAANMKVVTLSNDCQTIVEIVSDDKITNFPAPITDDLFAVNVIGGGIAIYDKTGAKKSELQSFSASSLFAGKYILKTEGIYDLTGKMLYDFKANDATYVNMGGALLISAIADNGDAKYYRWADGNAVEVKGETVKASTYGYYYVVSETKKDGETVKSYSYFNAKGEALGVYESEFSIITSTDDYIIAKGYEKNAETGKNEAKIYKLTITK